MPDPTHGQFGVSSRRSPGEQRAYMDGVYEARENFPSVDAEVIGALRLAFEAGSSDRAKVEIAERLLNYAPPTVPTSLGPTRLLLRAVKESDVSLVVT